MLVGHGHVERAQRTHTGEFYERYDGDLEIAPLNRSLLAWEDTYNTIRPHRSLDGRTPRSIFDPSGEGPPKVGSFPAFSQVVNDRAFSKSAHHERSIGLIARAKRPLEAQALIESL